MKVKLLLVFWVFCFLIFGCNGCAVSSDGNFSKGNNADDDSKIITIVNWNTQEFFDSQTDGCEYKEFQSAKNWNEDKYKNRLERLCEVLQELNADIYVLEEIENEAVIHDIANQMIGSSWKKGELWSYSCFAKTPGTAIGVAILSRYPLSDVKVHGLDIRTQNSRQPSMRPILEATANIGDKPLSIFVNHWKSKSGGAEKSDIWRDWHESQLAGLLIKRKSEDAGFSAVMCGDYNRDAAEFILNQNMDDKKGNVIFRYAGFGERKNLKVYNPWFRADGKYSGKTGSYFYNGDWERIDHIFSFGNASVTNFSPCTGESWADEEGIPIGYKVYKGTGYSDHLPVKATVRIK